MQEVAEGSSHESSDGKQRHGARWWMRKRIRKLFPKSRLSGVSATLSPPPLQMERRRLDQQLTPGTGSAYRRSVSASSALAQTHSFRYLKGFLMDFENFFLRSFEVMEDGDLDRGRSI